MNDDFKNGDGEILYLRYATRGLMLDHALFGSLGVSGGFGQARVIARNPVVPASHATVAQPLVKILRPSEGMFKAQLKWLRSYADLRDDRLPEISLQQDDILSFFGAVGLLDDQRRLRTLELLEATVRFAIHIEMMVKHLCRAPRPIDYAPEVQPIVQTPDHSSFPSGHATEAFAVATVFHRLMTGKGPKDGVAGRAQVFRLAHRIAVNRTVAGVHFPVDSAAGALLGCRLGEHIFGLANGADHITESEFRPGQGHGTGLGYYDCDNDFDLGWLEESLPAELSPGSGVKSDILAEFWTLATKEWP